MSAPSEFIASCDVVQVLRERLAVDEQFIRDHHGYCREYPQNARVEFIGELIEKHEHWRDKDESWYGAEDYCSERWAFLNNLLLLVAQHWDSLIED